MIVKKLDIKNFRNIVSLTVKFDNNINLIYGDNAQGKTNLIEAIYFSSVLKSFRSKKNDNLINKNSKRLFLNTCILNNKVNNDIKINLEKNNIKRISVDNKKVNTNEFYKILNCIIYYPDEISYLKFYPEYRRNHIDKSIFYIENKYLKIYQKYIKCLKQRNNFLKINNADLNNDIWKDQLIEYGSEIINYRYNYVMCINDKLNIIYGSNNINEKYSIVYDKYDFKNLKDDLYKKFKLSEEKELKYGYSLVGPHTDDFIFCLNDKDIKIYSSEGQKKTFLFYYKQAEIINYKENHGFYPVLILDDMGSELDKSRKKNIFYKLIENCGQVFITTTELPENFMGSSIFKINDGTVTEIK